MSSLASGSRNSQNNQPLSLQELEQRDRFIHRHIGPSEQDIAEMLQTLGMSSLDELIDKAVPDSIRMSGELELPESRNFKIDVPVKIPEPSLFDVAGIFEQVSKLISLNLITSK